MYVSMPRSISDFVSSGVFCFTNWSKIFCKIAAAAAYLGFHLGIHASIFTKGKGMGLDQNPEYLLN